MYRKSEQEDRSLVVTAFSGRIHAVDRMTGAVRWRYEMGDQGEVELAIGRGLVIGCARKTLCILDYASGRMLKSVLLAGEYASRPTMLVDGEQILVGRSGELVSYTLGG